MRSPRALRRALATLCFALAASPAVPAMAETVVPVARFSSITVRSGARVVLRHGRAQSVTVLQGDTRCAGISVDEGGRLVIDKYRGDCPRYELEIDVVTPAIDEIMVMDGGTIETRGAFPSQAELAVAVGDGGTIDARSMTAGVVTAAVKSGGRIFTRPQDVLLANVTQGGIIRFWGDPRVKSSIQHGGSVRKGTAAEADLPLSEMGPTAPRVPDIPRSTWTR